MNVKWHGDEVLKEAHKEAVKLITKAAIMGEAETKRMLKGPSPSLPGHPPGTISGRYAGSITHEVDPANLVSRWGSNMRVGKQHQWSLGAILELGTEKMAARPHYRVVVAWLQRQFK